MAVESRKVCIVADRVLGMLRSKDFQDIGSLWGVHDELGGLERAISVLRPLIHDMEKEVFLPPTPGSRLFEDDTIINRLWESEARLEEAVNLLEDLPTGANYYLRPGNQQIQAKVRHFFSNPKYFKLNMRQTLEYLNKRLAVTKAAERRFDELDFEKDREIQFPNGVEEVESFIVQGEVITNSLDHMAKVEITNILLDMKFEQNVTVVPLLILGRDTTMFAWEVFYNGRVRKHFDKRIWLRVLEKDDSIEILRKIVAHAAGLDGWLLQRSNKDELTKLLRASLSGVRYLIVLCKPFFGVPPENWLFLRDLLLGVGDKGSKVVVSTSNKELTISITGSTIVPYRIGCPSEDELWSLFEKVAFGQRPKDTPEEYSSRIQAGWKENCKKDCRRAYKTPSGHGGNRKHVVL